MATKKKPVKKTKSKTPAKRKTPRVRKNPEAVKLEFTLNAEGMLQVNQVFTKGADQRLVNAAQAAHKLFFQKSVEQGGVPVKIGDRIVVAERAKF